MKTWLVVLLALAPVLRADWRAELKPLEPGKFPPLRPLTASYRFGWGVVPSADASIDFSRLKKDQLQLKLTTKTIGVTRGLWQLDAEHTARCAASTLRPISFQQIERYRDETEKTKVEFAAEGLTRQQERIPPAKVPTRPKRFKFSRVADLHTALLLVRSQALRQGDRYSLVVYPSRTAYLAQIDVVGREELKVAGRSYDAIKLQVGLQHITKSLELEPHEKFKSAFAWLSDDGDRLLLKIQTEVFVGNVWMELRSVKYAAEKP